MSGGKAPSVTATPQYPAYNEAMNTMGNLANQWAGQLGQPYGGNMVANFSPAQQTAQTQLQSYMNTNPTGYMQDPGYQAARTNLMNTAAGDYTTANSPYTQQMSQYYLNQVLPQSQALMNQQAARMGNLSGSSYDYLNSQLGQSAQNQLLAYGAQNYATERQNQLNALSPAMNLTQQEQYAPSNWINNLMNLGSASQNLNQEQLSAAYNDFLRQQQQQMSVINMAPQAAQQMNYSYDPGKQSFMQQYVMPILQWSASPFTGNSGGSGSGQGTNLSNLLSSFGSNSQNTGTPDYANNYGAEMSNMDDYQMSTDLAGGSY